jgi:hypothetical protein
MSSRKRQSISISAVVVIVATVAATSCLRDTRTALEELIEARSLTADVRLQFSKVSDAGNRAVMAETEETASAATKEVAAATMVIDADINGLSKALTDLQYSDESGVLTTIVAQLAEFRSVDREVLELASLDTNIKAQKLSFGPAQDAAAEIDSDLSAVVAASARDPRIRAVAAETLAALREMQVLQAPHIAEADSATMDRFESRMNDERHTVESGLASLQSTSNAKGKAAADRASAAFKRFLDLHAQILELSRRNSNVRSLALALGKRRTLAAACDERLAALQDALNKREIGPSR